MHEYTQIAIGVLSFIGGSGISTVVSLGYVRKRTKLEFATQAIKFSEDYAQNLMKRVQDLETTVERLEEISCIRKDCNIRIKAQ